MKKGGGRIWCENVQSVSRFLSKIVGVLIDDAQNWKYHISYIKSRIARNTGIISILHYLSLEQLKQLYYNIIYPHISHGILSWGSTCKTHLQNLQTKLNHVVRLIFFATAYGPSTVSALPLLNLLDILTVENVFGFFVLKLTCRWHKGELPDIFQDFSRYASSGHAYNTRYAV